MSKKDENWETLRAIDGVMYVQLAEVGKVLMERLQRYGILKNALTEIERVAGQAKAAVAEMKQ